MQQRWRAAHAQPSGTPRLVQQPPRRCCRVAADSSTSSSTSSGSRRRTSSSGGGGGRFRSRESDGAAAAAAPPPPATPRQRPSRIPTAKQPPVEGEQLQPQEQLQPTLPAAAPDQQQHQQLPGARLSSLLPAGQVAVLRSYLAHLLEVNQVMNLTAIRDPQEAWQRHIEDSLALLPVIDAFTASHITHSSSSGSGSGRLRVIDVGSGAGLPGMVLAVVRPDWQVTLLDSLRKRCDFLEATAELLGLRNVSVVWSRAEDAGRAPGLRDAADLAVARAVAELRVLAELCLPLVRPGGLWVAAKGALPQDEVAAARPALSKLGGRLLAVESVASWTPEGAQRTAVVAAKLGPTPALYPRQAGTPGKKPL